MTNGDKVTAFGTGSRFDVIFNEFGVTPAAEDVEAAAHELSRTVVVVMHDINMAAAWADRIVALRDGAVVVQGTPEETMTQEYLSKVFGMEVPVHDLEGRRVDMVWG